MGTYNTELFEDSSFIRKNAEVDGNANEKENGSIIVKCYSVCILNICTIDFHQVIAAINCFIFYRKLLNIYDLFDNEKPSTEETEENESDGCIKG